MMLVRRMAMHVPSVSLKGSIMPARRSPASKLMDTRLAGSTLSTLPVKSTNGIGNIIIGFARKSPDTTGSSM